MFSQTCVKDSVHRLRGECISQHALGQTSPLPSSCWDTHRPWSDTPSLLVRCPNPPWSDTPQDRHPPVRHPPPPGQTQPPGQTPPPWRPLQCTVRILLECILVSDFFLNRQTTSILVLSFKIHSSIPVVDCYTCLTEGRDPIPVVDCQHLLDWG